MSQKRKIFLPLAVVIIILMAGAAFVTSYPIKSSANSSVPSTLIVAPQAQVTTMSEAATLLPTPILEASKPPEQYFETMLIVPDGSSSGRVYQASGNDLESLQISSDDVHGPGPSLSPDGKRIAFRDLNGYLNVYDISSQKTTTYPNVLMSGLWSMGWSPDGERFAYGCPTVPSNLCVFTLKTGEFEQITHLGDAEASSWAGYTFAGWSSDGDKMGILYYVEPPVTAELERTYFLGTLELLDLRTGDMSDVLAENSLSGIEHFQNAALSPDGSSFLFSAKSGDYYAIYQVNVDGSGLTRVTPEMLQFDIINPVWRPDGIGFVAYAPEQGKGSSDSIYLPTIFDLSGKILGQIAVPGGGMAESWVEGEN